MSNILITGASGGIGNEILNVFKKNNHNVYSPRRNEIDLSRPVKLNKNNFDVIVNCAGINEIKNFLNISDNLDATLKTNFFSSYEIIKQCIPYMLKKRYGRVINIGSIWINKSKKGRLSYSISKNALHCLTKYLTVEYSQYNILANTISPGFIKTNMTSQNNSVAQINKIKNKIPCKRLGFPEEVAKLVYQMSIDNTYITGQEIIIDGGLTCVI